MDERVVDIDICDLAPAVRAGHSLLLLAAGSSEGSKSVKTPATFSRVIEPSGNYRRQD